MNSEIKFLVEGEKIGHSEQAFIVAEVSSNHNNNLERTKEIIDGIAKTSAKGIKFQTYKPESLIVNSDKPYILPDNNEWAGEDLSELYKKGSLPYEWHKELFDYCYEKGLIPFSSVFDTEGLDLVMSLNVKILKIASYEACDINFVKLVLSKGILTFISIGGLSENEVKRLVDTINESDNKKVVLLNCLSAYPAPLNEFNFRRIERIEKEYSILSGLSDHSTSSYAALISITLGAKVIEKHVTLSETDKIADKSFSMSVLDFAEYCKLIREAEESLNSNSFESQESEQSNLILKRSIVASENIETGDVFSKENITVKRPNIGLEPHFYNFVLGKKANYNYVKGEGISEKELQN